MAEPFVVVVTGGRDFLDRDFVYRALDAAHRKRAITTLVVGRATGADTLAEDWAVARGVPVLPFPALWDDIDVPGAVVRFNRDGTPYNVAAGSQRNQRMIDEGYPTGAVRFPGGRGTADMADRLDRAGIRTWVPAYPK